MSDGGVKDGVNVGWSGLEVRELDMTSACPGKVGGNGRRTAACYRYRWRHRDRVVWVTQDAEVVDRVLGDWWHVLGTVPLDVEYHAQPLNADAAVVSIAVSRDVAILWHRPLSRLDQARNLPDQLAHLLLSERHPKVGFAIDHDVWKLAASTNLLNRGWPRGIFDLQTFFRVFARREGGNPIGMIDSVNAVNPPSNQFCKLEHKGNWGHNRLSADQVVYAAGDVFVTWEVIDAYHSALPLRIAESHNQPPRNGIAHRQPSRNDDSKSGSGVSADPYDRLMGEMKRANEIVKHPTHESATWLVKNCPTIVSEAMAFLLESIEEDKLPKLPRLRTFLMSCCPAISNLKNAGMNEPQITAIADQVVRFLLHVRWLITDRQDPAHLMYHLSSQTLRFILQQRKPTT